VCHGAPVDHPTHDGTCLRDYVHVEDLVEAHAAVMEAPRPGDPRRFNLGIGRGRSVREIIDAALTVGGQALPTEGRASSRGRSADPHSNPGKIRRELGWQARRTDIAATIESAWRWFRSHPDGYARVSASVG
jgi:UDP-glucose 4-epimerase